MSIFKKKKSDADLMEEDKKENPERQWPSQKAEGELAVDIYETEKEFVIESPIAGITAKDLDISVEEDMLTIRGKRERPQDKEKRNYFLQECFWGPFSKKIILPEKVKITQAKATVRRGILRLSIPKENEQLSKKISISDK